MSPFKDNRNGAPTIVLLLALIASGSTIVDSGTFIAKLLVQVTLLSAVIYYLLYKVKIRKSTIKKIFHRGFPLFSLFFIASALNGSGIAGDEVTFLLKILLAMLLAILISTNFEETIQSYITLIKYVVVISIVINLFVYTYPAILIAVPDGIQTGHGFKTAFGINYYAPSAGVVFRNQAFFWEPGCFSFFINLAIIFQLRKQKFPDLILMVGMLSTFSMGGILILLLILTISYINRYGKAAKLISLVFLSFIPIFFPEFIKASSFVTEILFGRDLLADESFSARAIDFYFPFEVALNYFWYGHGLNNMTAYINTAISSGATGQVIITNSWTFMAYSFGYICLAAYLFLVFKNKSIHNGNRLFLLPIFLALAHEPLAFSVFFMAIMFSSNIRVDHKVNPDGVEVFQKTRVKIKEASY